MAISSDTVVTPDNKAGIEILRLVLDGEEGSLACLPLLSHPKTGSWHATYRKNGYI